MGAGEFARATAPYIITEFDTRPQALLARSAWKHEFGGRIAFARSCAAQQTSYTGDRTEFLGRNGSAESPGGARTRRPLSGKVGAGLDPCAALQTTFELRPGAQVEIVSFWARRKTSERSARLGRRYRAADLNAVLDDVDGAVGRHSGRHPGRDARSQHGCVVQSLAALPDALLPRLGASRVLPVERCLWFPRPITGRDGAGVARREITREQILLRAPHINSSQGDVQHWWHPPSGRGIRTRMSDDLLWLPYAVNHFIEATGDMTVLDEQVAVSRGRRIGRRAVGVVFRAAHFADTRPRFSSIARGPSIAA